ncbi:MAG: UvrD-helicase domain-containing protein, partial [Thermodesulfobacterium sp.]|nr:UvrD-helicase domain-containing protein [Thermodesulfobacterium sp.]
MFNSLSEEQKLVLSTPGDLLVIAGPGSGKTRTLVAKVVRLLEEGVSPEKIYLLTFSVKVSLELRKRLEELGLKGVKVDTFHGLAYDLIKAKDGKPPTVISEKERDEILKKLFPGVKAPLSKDELKRIYYDYLEKNGFYDFDFLVYKASTLEGFNFKDSYVIVDEFQDIAQDLFSLLEMLTPATWVFFGDPNQSIYGFRGANPEKLKTFLEKAKP